VRGVPPPYDLDGVQLDVLGAEVFEEPASLTEQDRDQMDLYLVEEPRLETTWAVPTPWTSTFFSPAAFLARRTASLRSLR
jgi:hypothetical protein